MRRVDRSERGVTMILVAVTMVAMLAAAALAIDLGQGYTSRRNMQNAADAAALAGARQLFKTQNQLTGLFADPTVTVQAAVMSAATDNGASSGQVTCNVVDSSQNVIAPCALPLVWILGSPAGVAVSAGVTNATAFGKVLSQSTVAVNARATALIQPLVSSTGSTFIVCGKASIGGWDILDNNGGIKASAVTNPITHLPKYNLQESQQRDCGAGSTFKGKTADPTEQLTVGSWALGGSGNGNSGAVFDAVAGQVPCPPNGPYTGCAMVIPIADASMTGTLLHVANFGVFQVFGDGTGNPKYYGYLLAAGAPITRGEGGAGQCSVGTACVIKLVN